MTPFTILLLTITMLLQTQSLEANDNVEKTCRISTDYTFCKAVLNVSDTSPIALAKTATEHALKVITLAQPKMESIARGTRDQVGKARIEACRKDYSIAFQDFNNAYKALLVPRANEDSLKKVFDDSLKGSHAILNCESVYKTSKPVTDCPVLKQNHDVAKLMEITRIIVDHVRLNLFAL